jgi:hypothetical protein
MLYVIQSCTIGTCPGCVFEAGGEAVMQEAFISLCRCYMYTVLASLPVVWCGHATRKGGGGCSGVNRCTYVRIEMDPAHRKVKTLARLRLDFRCSGIVRLAHSVQSLVDLLEGVSGVGAGATLFPSAAQHSTCCIVMCSIRLYSESCGRFFRSSRCIIYG